jgi:hypothetical protein
MPHRLTMFASHSTTLRSGSWFAKRNKSVTGWLAVTCLNLAILLFTPSLAARVDYELGIAATFCKEFRLGRWTFEDSRDPEGDDVLYFRWKDTEKSVLLVRSTRFGMLDYAAKEIYALNLSAREVRRATDDEWREGLEAEPFGCYSKGASCGSEWLLTNEDQPLVIGSRKMPMAGRYWPGTARSAAIPSPRKTWILLQGIQGIRGQTH